MIFVSGIFIAVSLPPFSVSQTFFELVPHFISEGNDTPLQYSCLENPMDGGAQ